jgi:hypothetical protein
MSFAIKNALGFRPLQRPDPVSLSNNHQHEKDPYCFPPSYLFYSNAQVYSSKEPLVHTFPLLPVMKKRVRWQ